jgi:hypothetical protein
MMSFSRPIQWYHSHADPIWPDRTLKVKSNYNSKNKNKDSPFFCTSRNRIKPNLVFVSSCKMFSLLLILRPGFRASAWAPKLFNNGKRKITIVSVEDKTSLNVASILQVGNAQRKTKTKKQHEQLLVFGQDQRLYV